MKSARIAVAMSEVAEEVFRNDAHPGRPHSVSSKAWPILKAHGEWRKTRIFDEFSFFAAVGDEPVRDNGITIFNRVSDRMGNGVFEMSVPFGQEYAGQDMRWARTGRSLAYFIDAEPRILISSSSGMVPIDDSKVPLSSSFVPFASAARAVAACNVATEDPALFAAETTLIDKVVKRIAQRRAPSTVFFNLAMTARDLGMLRLEALAEHRLRLDAATKARPYKIGDLCLTREP